MDRKILSVIASVLLLFVLVLWLTQYQDEGAQTATSPSGTRLAASNARPSAVFNAFRNASPDTRLHNRYAAQSTLNSQATSAITPPARNSVNNNPSQNNSSTLESADQTKNKVEPALLAPRAEPYALMANSGNVNVRFSVRLTGDTDPTARVYLRQSGMDDVITMNDQGVNGDYRARDNIYGAHIPINTSAVAADSCLAYEAFINNGGTEVVSAPMQLCVSSFPVRTATPNVDEPVVLNDGVKAVADEVLLYAKPTTSAATIRELAHSINASVVGSIIPLNLYQLRLPSPVSAGRLLEIIAQLNTHSEIMGASVNTLAQPAGHVDITTDPEFANQDGVKLVTRHPTQAGNYVWDAGAIGTGVTVIVTDEGLDRSHPDFGVPGDCQLSTSAAPGVANTDCGGTNNDNATAGIYQWHGTRVAGIIAAKAYNSQGIAGVAHGSRIYSYKIGSYTLAYMDQIFIDAGSHVISEDASVINASFGGGPWNPSGAGYILAINALCAAVNTAITSGNGAIAVIAAGNNGTDNWFYPARCNQHSSVPVANRERIIAVGNSASVVTANCGSVGIDQRCAAAIPANSNLLGSNYGAWVDIMAPGSDIRSTISGGYSSSTGTSFSAPIVSGAVAILKSCGVPLDSIKSTLTNSANVMVPYPGGSIPRLDVYSALEQVNHVPAAVLLSNNSLNDGTDTTAGVEVGTLIATDTDTCDKWTYSIAGGADAAKFSIGGTDSDRLILTDGVLNSATKSSYAVTVHVTDFFGATFDQAQTVDVVTVNNPPTISDQTFRINESSANGTTVGKVVASDPDSGNVLSYSIAAGNTSNAFSIDTGTGVLSVNNSAALVYAINPAFALTVTVIDGGGLSASATVTVNVNKAPVISNQTFSVNESAANGTAVGAVVASDAGDTLSYSITAGNTGGAFSINSSTGIISVSAALSYATTPTYNLTVLVTDSGGLTASATITVNVNAPPAPANNAPVIADQVFTIDEGSANGTVVGLVVASDPDAGNSLSYSITGGNANGAFAINPTTGMLTVSNSAALNYASNPTFSLTVQVTDSGNLSASATVTVNLNAPPAFAPPPFGGGGCSVMPAGANPDFSLLLALLAVLAYRLRRRLGIYFGQTRF